LIVDVERSESRAERLRVSRAIVQIAPERTNRCAERIKCRLLSVCLRCETARETESRLVWHLTRRSRGDLLRKSVAISRSEETSGTRQEAVGCSGRRVAAREVCFSQSWHGGCNFCCRCDDRRCDTSR